MPNGDKEAMIHRAFPGRAIEPGLFADRDGRWTAYFAQAEFEAGSVGRSWDLLAPEFIERHSGALRYMNADAFAALLPAYLASLVRGDTRNELPPLVLQQLTRKPEDGEEFDARVSHLSIDQRLVVAAVLEGLRRGDRFSHYRAEIVDALKSWPADPRSRT